MKSLARVGLAGYLVLYQRDITETRIQSATIVQERREVFIPYDDLQVIVGPRVSFASPEGTR
jgi:hypothetical protein